MQHSVFWSPGMKLETLEEHVIIKAYAFYQNNKTATANSLGISIRTLDNKLEKYERNTFEEELAEDVRKREREEFLIRSRGIQGQGFDNSATPRVETYASNVDLTKKRVHMESTAKTSKEHSLPVQERLEVQEVLPKHSTGSSNTRRR